MEVMNKMLESWNRGHVQTDLTLSDALQGAMYQIASVQADLFTSHLCIHKCSW